MLIIKNLPEQIQILNKCLQNKGVICFPTETVYALACDATKSNAVNKIFEIKARNKNKQLSILVYDIKTAKKYAVIDDCALALMKKFSPGPITYILPNKNLPNWPKYLGIRIPKHPIAQLILKHYPYPLVGTSVNISDKVSAKTLNEIPEPIKESVDIIVGNTSKAKVSGLPSTIINLSMPEKYNILREGEINKANINDAYKTNI